MLSFILQAVYFGLNKFPHLKDCLRGFTKCLWFHLIIFGRISMCSINNIIFWFFFWTSCDRIKCGEYSCIQSVLYILCVCAYIILYRKTASYLLKTLNNSYKQQKIFSIVIKWNCNNIYTFDWNDTGWNALSKIYIYKSKPELERKRNLFLKKKI